MTRRKPVHAAPTEQNAAIELIVQWVEDCVPRTDRKTLRSLFPALFSRDTTRNLADAVREAIIRTFDSQQGFLYVPPISLPTAARILGMTPMGFQRQARKERLTEYRHADGRIMILAYHGKDVKPVYIRKLRELLK
jgi:hypothetical protein